MKATANRLSRKWKEDRDDVAQELYLWIFSKLDYNFFDEDQIDDEEYDENLRRFRSSVSWAGERYCRQAKAEREGYSPGDEYFYSIPQLIILLPVLINDGVQASPPVTRGDSVKRSVDAAEGGGHLASMIDLDVALEKLDKRYQDRLKLRFGALAGFSDESCAGLSQSDIVTLTGLHPETYKSILGVTKDQVASRVKTSLIKLQNQLGGRSPWKTSDWSRAA